MNERSKKLKVTVVLLAGLGVLLLGAAAAALIWKEVGIWKEARKQSDQLTQQALQLKKQADQLSQQVLQLKKQADQPTNLTNIQSLEELLKRVQQLQSEIQSIDELMRQAHQLKEQAYQLTEQAIQADHLLSLPDLRPIDEVEIQVLYLYDGKFQAMDELLKQFDQLREKKVSR